VSVSSQKESPASDSFCLRTSTSAAGDLIRSLYTPGLDSPLDRRALRPKMSDPALEASSIDFTLGNPLLSLVAAVLRAALYVLNLTRKLITFATLTVPRLVVTVLHFSWTLQVRY
jgi:hypothetical protein